MIGKILTGVLITSIFTPTVFIPTVFAGTMPTCIGPYQQCSSSASCCHPGNFSCKAMIFPNGKKEKVCSPEVGLADGQHWSGSFIAYMPLTGSHHSDLTIHMGYDVYSHLHISYTGLDSWRRSTVYTQYISIKDSGNLEGSLTSGVCDRTYYYASGPEKDINKRICTYKMPDPNTLIIDAGFYKATLHLQHS